MREPLVRLVGLIAGLEPAVVTMAAPFLLFPTLRPAWTAVALAALLAVWLAGWIATRKPWPQTPLNGALLLFAITIPVGVWASAHPDLTIPKLTGVILGLAAFRATVNAASSRRHLWLASELFIALGLGLVVIGLLGAYWHVKWSALRPILAQMPHLFDGLPGAEHGINLNELAGALVLFLPLSLARLAGRKPDRDRAEVVVWLAALAITVIVATVILLTQSRSAWIGVLAAAGVMGWLRWPRWRWLMAAGVTIAALALLYVGPLETLQTLFAPSEPVDINWMADDVTLRDRTVLWGRAMQAIGDFPLTGCGLGAFRQVTEELYPFSSRTFGSDIAHAHNIFLQTALDLGLPGLVAYLALVGTALWIGWRVARPPLNDSPSSGSARDEFRWLGLGIVGALVASHAYGITDTVALGAKPGAALWILLGLAAALWSVAAQGAPELTEVV